MRAATIVSGCLVASCVASVLAPGSASADQVTATRYEMIERSHVIEMKVDRGVATLVVQRTVSNTGPKSDQATFHLDIPTTSVATRLRTAGANGMWFEGELLEAEAAAKKYRELTGIGGYYPKDPALLSWRHQGELALQVFPVLGQSSKTVEYTLKMPLVYENGAYRVAVPALGTENLPASVRVAATHPEDILVVNGVSGAGGSAISIRADKTITIELRPRNVPAIDTAFASVAIADEMHLVRGRIAAAPRVGEVPAGAHVVVLFDASKSHRNPAAGLAAVRAYLGHMTGATVEFLTFDREVRAPIGRSLSVANALAKLSVLDVQARNGSAVDQALARADAILQSSAAQVKRVVVVTDTLTRSALTPSDVGRATWKSGALVHFAIVEEGMAQVTRDDDSSWSVLPRRTGGVFWRSSAPALIDAHARTTFEEWARPKRIDKLRVKGLTGLEAPGAAEIPPVLDEGQGIDHFVITGAATSRVEITGELWSKPVRITSAPTAEQGKLASAMAFASDLHTQLDEPQQMRLAMLGGAVSPVTSYLAIEPGVRPSNEGLEWGSVGRGGGLGAGMGFGDAHGRMFGAGGASRIDKRAFLVTQLVAAMKTCNATGPEASATLESTLDEIVDVVTVELAPTRDAKGEACIREELWKIDLPEASFTDGFEAHAVHAKR